MNSANVFAEVIILETIVNVEQKIVGVVSWIKVIACVIVLLLYAKMVDLRIQIIHANANVVRDILDQGVK